MLTGSLLIGIDLDNTLIDYDRLFTSLAVEQGLLGHEQAGSKLAVRDTLRAADGGEQHWRALQRLAYGPRILEAEVAPGACAFLEQLAAAGGRAVIVSHKTRTPKQFPEPDFHAAALGFLEENRLLTPHTPIQSVHFQPTRPGKAALVAELGCTHFIDDLVEVFAEPEFPQGVARYLYRKGSTTEGGHPSAPQNQAAHPDKTDPRDQAVSGHRAAPDPTGPSHKDSSPDQAAPHAPWDLAGDWPFLAAHLFAQDMGQGD